MYKVTIKVYENVADQKEVESFHSEREHALIAYKTASEIASMLKWTRHFAVDEEIEHMGEKKNLFNEGSILLEVVEVWK
jgi:hypothetical protein